MIYKGIKFGLLLQLAIGPICLFVFQTAVSNGLRSALLGVFGVAIVDALFILVAIWGVGSLINRHRHIKTSMKIFGAFVLMLFGFNTLSDAFHISFLPSLSLSTIHITNIFYKMMILTFSNPLTIVFWTGVFSVKVTEENMSQNKLYLFGLGAVIATLLFLTVISIVGHALAIAISAPLLTMMNVTVALFLIGFGIKTLKTKEDQQ
ncbi:LysE family transporter [Fervidibacillus albus]|uniref:LysE family translocator n=1 Tax=Fervidibacillus albus TaxID=2980026 RepID=A0A9E8LTT4_9BACI|nr:LysE family transporter [Fervidibacillus albus]WAA09397.1 LysE family translocator [Fervidibacillus albus]